MTQTPPSGPKRLVTTPPISLSSIATGALRCSKFCWAASSGPAPATRAAASTAAMVQCCFMWLLFLAGQIGEDVIAVVVGNALEHCHRTARHHFLRGRDKRRERVRAPVPGCRRFERRRISEV